MWMGYISRSRWWTFAWMSGRYHCQDNSTSPWILFFFYSWNITSFLLSISLNHYSVLYIIFCLFQELHTEQGTIRLLCIYEYMFRIVHIDMRTKNDDNMFHRRVNELILVPNRWYMLLHYDVYVLFWNEYITFFMQKINLRISRYIRVL